MTRNPFNSDNRRNAALRSLSRIDKNKRKIPHIVVNGVEMKSCSKCGSLKPLDQFYNYKGRGDGKHPHCKGCFKK